MHQIFYFLLLSKMSMVPGVYGFKFANNEFIVAPFADYINHSFSPNVDWKSEIIDQKQGSSIIVYSTQDIDENSQLYFNYSCRNNLHYCIKYGFVTYKSLGIELHLDHTMLFEKLSNNSTVKQMLLKTFGLSLDKNLLTLKHNDISDALTFARIINIDDITIINKGIIKIEILDYSKPLPLNEENNAVDSLLNVFTPSLRAVSKDYKGMMDKINPISNKSNYDTYNMLKLHDEEKTLLAYYIEKLNEHKKKILSANSI